MVVGMNRRVTTKFTYGMYEKLEKCSEELGCPRSDVIRIAVAEYIKRWENLEVGWYGETKDIERWIL